MLSKGTVGNAEEWGLTGVPMVMTLLPEVLKCHQVGIVNNCMNDEKSQKIWILAADLN